MTTRPDRIDPEVAYEYITNGRARLLDARPRHEYLGSVETLPDAVHVDPDEGAATDEQLARFPRELLLIAFCDEPNQAASAGVARRARSLGRGDASVLEGGMRAWKAAGLPTVPLSRNAPTPRTLETASPVELEKLCRLAFWLRGMGTCIGEWGTDRAAIERFLAPVPRAEVERYRAFLRYGDKLLVPEEHEKRIANLPPSIRERAATVFGLAPGEEALREVISAEDSALLLRWFTWTGEIPEHNAWWADQRL